MERQLAAVITDPQFEKLELRMREINIFRALAVERSELCHSSFFAFLLDPRENHGLDDIFLRKFLRDIFADSRAKGRTLFEVDLMDFGRVDVRREWRNIDILIDLPADIITIENKVDSTEHDDQLKRYRAIVNEEFPAKRKHFVYLTPFSDEAAEAEDQAVYINYSYAQIADILENVLTLYRDSISDKMVMYLEDYRTTIKRELLMNDELNDLAAKIYKAHRAAFEFVFENRPDPASILYPYFEEEVRSRGFVVSSKNKGYIRFTSKDLAKRLPKRGQGWPDKDIFLFEINYFWAGKNVVAQAVIAPGDEALRQSIFAAAQHIEKYHPPEGKKWLAFYRRKMKFDATQISNEEEADIKVQVKQVIDAVADDAAKIFATIAAELPKEDVVT